MENTQFSFGTRFEDGIGTNPEELIAAAHAGCFNMKLSFVLGNSGFVPEKLEILNTLDATIIKAIIIGHKYLVQASI